MYTDIGRLAYKTIKSAVEHKIEKNIYLMPFNLAYHEACKKPVGSIEEFEESNLELKRCVFYFLINKGYVIMKVTEGDIFFSLTNKAITEYIKKPRENWGWNPGKR